MLPWTPPASLTLSLQQQQQQQQSHYSGGPDAVSAPMQGGHQQQLQHHQAQQQQQQHGQLQPNVQLHHQQSPQQQGQPQHIQQPQQQQQQQLGPSPQQPNGPPTGVAPSAPINLGQVLHFLQTEWRRYERERNEWEIERGEMRARIALLEGERRGNENLKTDLMRRVKMLEYALRQERQKYLAHQQSQAQAAAQQVSKDKERDRAKSEESSKRLDRDDKASEKGSGSAVDKKKAHLLVQAAKETTTSGRASPGLSMVASIGDDMEKSVNSLPEVIVSTAYVGGGLTRPSSTLSLNTLPQGSSAIPSGVVTATAMSNGQPLPAAQGALGWNPSLGRDPRGRAKSREYLKQCLQEITYLTSVTALNPLPGKTVAGISRPRKAVVDMPVISGGQAFAAMPATNGRDAGLAGDVAPSNQPETQTETVGAPAQGNRDVRGDTAANSTSTARTQQSESLDTETLSKTLQGSEVTSKPSAPVHGRDTSLSRVEELPERTQPGFEGSATIDGNAQSQPTDVGRKAVYAPISPKTVLSPLLPDGHIGRHRSESTSSTSSAATLVGDAHKTWKAKRTLRAHLDSVRCLAFDRIERPTDVVLASGGDDCSIKLWRMAPALLASATRSMTLPDSDPFHTFRGHAAPLTALVISTVTEHLYSASLDCTVGVWYMPSRDADLYAPFDEGSHIYKLEGHTDAIWDICILASNINSGNGRSSEVVASASADKTVKIWQIESSTLRDGRPTGKLRLSLSAAGEDGDVTAKSPTPTCITLCQSDMTRLAVGYSDGIVRIFDIESGRLLLSSKPESLGSALAQINRLVSHPTLPLLVTGHEDGYIRLTDLKNGNCSHTIQAHSDAVTAIDIDPAGLTLTSASHDGVIRFWDLLQSRTCLQDIQNTHRSKGDEGVLDVRFHPTLPFVASAGADGNVRIYG